VEETPEDALPVERVAALDIGKAEVVCCVRVPNPSGSARRVQEVRTFTTMTRSLQAMGDWLAGLGVTRIVMEATSDYWKPPFYLLDAAGFDVWLVNARDVKHLPGRPKTDLLTELRGGSRSSVRQLPVGGATFPGHDRRRGQHAESVPVGGCATRVA
jgi:transposase